MESKADTEEKKSVDGLSIARAYSEGLSYSSSQSIQRLVLPKKVNELPN